MSPNIVGKKDKIDNRFDSREFIKIKKKMQEIKKFVEKNFEFVGDKFPQEVRQIYYDNKKNKNIYGTVSPQEKKELKEEGIELASIPWVKDTEN